MTGWNRGFDIPADLATRIAKLRAAVMFDIYAYGDDDESPRQEADVGEGSRRTKGVRRGAVRKPTASRG
jgi:hypothetical protein